jgi:hypothetical protein
MASIDSSSDSDVLSPVLYSIKDELYYQQLCENVTVTQELQVDTTINQCQDNSQEKRNSHHNDENVHVPEEDSESSLSLTAAHLEMVCLSQSQPLLPQETMSALAADQLQHSRRKRSYKGIVATEIVVRKILCLPSLSYTKILQYMNTEEIKTALGIVTNNFYIDENGKDVAKRLAWMLKHGSVRKIYSLARDLNIPFTAPASVASVNSTLSLTTNEKSKRGRKPKAMPTTALPNNLLDTNISMPQSPNDTVINVSSDLSICNSVRTENINNLSTPSNLSNQCLRASNNPTEGTDDTDQEQIATLFNINTCNNRIDITSIVTQREQHDTNMNPQENIQSSQDMSSQVPPDIELPNSTTNDSNQPIDAINNTKRDITLPQLSQLVESNAIQSSENILSLDIEISQSMSHSENQIMEVPFSQQVEYSISQTSESSYPKSSRNVDMSAILCRLEQMHHDLGSLLSTFSYHELYRILKVYQPKLVVSQSREKLAKTLSSYLSKDPNLNFVRNAIAHSHHNELNPDDSKILYNHSKSTNQPIIQPCNQIIKQSTEFSVQNQFNSHNHRQQRHNLTLNNIVTNNNHNHQIMKDSPRLTFSDRADGEWIGVSAGNSHFNMNIFTSTCIVLQIQTKCYSSLQQEYTVTLLVMQPQLLRFTFMLHSIQPGIHATKVEQQFI